MSLHAIIFVRQGCITTVSGEKINLFMRDAFWILLKMKILFFFDVIRDIHKGYTYHYNTNLGFIFDTSPTLYVLYTIFSFKVIGYNYKCIGL